MLNSVALVGNLGRDPDAKYSKSGMAVTTFPLCFKSGKDKEGWINVILFNKLAESMGERLYKGARIGVTGILDENKWEDGQGNTKRNLQLIGNNIEFIKVGEKQTKKENPQSSLGSNNNFDNDIPF